MMKSTEEWIPSSDYKVGEHSFASLQHALAYHSVTLEAILFHGLDITSEVVRNPLFPVPRPAK